MLEKVNLLTIQWFGLVYFQCTHCVVLGLVVSAKQTAFDLFGPIR